MDDNPVADGEVRLARAEGDDAATPFDTNGCRRLEVDLPSAVGQQQVPGTAAGNHVEQELAVTGLPGCGEVEDCEWLVRGSCSDAVPGVPPLVVVPT